MKRVIAIALSLTMVLGSVNFVFGEYEEVGIKINGVPLIMDDSSQNYQLNALIVENRTMAPIRPIFDKFGLKLTWNAADNSISTVTAEGKTLWMQIDNPVAKLDGQSYTMDIGPKVIVDRTYIPVKYLFDFLGLEYNWDGENSIVNVIAPSMIKFKTPSVLRDTYDEAIILSEDSYLIKNTIASSKICMLTLSKSTYDSEILNTASKLGITAGDLVEVTRQDFRYKIFRIDNVYSGIVLEKNGQVYSIEIKNMTNIEIEHLINNL